MKFDNTKIKCWNKGVGYSNAFESSKNDILNLNSIKVKMKLQENYEIKIIKVLENKIFDYFYIKNKIIKFI